MLNKFQAQVLDRRSCVLQRRHRRHRRQRRRRRCDGQEEGQQDLSPPDDQPLLLGLQLLGKIMVVKLIEWLLSNADWSTATIRFLT